MKEKIKIFFIIVFLFLPGVFYGENTPLNNGKEVVKDNENIKAKDGFGAQLWLIKPGDFFEKWKTPETPKLNVTKRVRRNVPVSTVILFVSPGINDKSQCDVVYDLVIRNPDGEVYASFKDLEVWQNKPAPPQGNIQLAVQNIGIIIENKDPLGGYTIDATVRDRVKKVEFSLRQGFTAEDPEVDIDKLQERVSEILKEDNVSRRRDVKDIYALIDVYLTQDKNKEAISLYEDALRVDSWNLPRQLAYANLLIKHRMKDEAVEKAKIIYQYAEDENLINLSEKLIVEQGLLPPFKKYDNVVISGIQIELVPIGKVNKYFLGELKDKVQATTGILYTVAGNSLDLGKSDRNQVDKYLSEMIEHIKSELSAEEVNSILRENNLDKGGLTIFDEKVKFVIASFSKKNVPLDEISQFKQEIEKMYEAGGQYDAQRLLALIQDNFKFKSAPAIKAYLGITEKDIFSDDNNFLFGWSKEGLGIFSYRRFMADFNDEPPNRPRLLERAAKQMISSSFLTLGIPRCTTPTCVRAYPHSLAELDQKGTELCSWCKLQLENYIKNNQ